MDVIKRIDFNHRGSFNVDKIINLINKLERKFGAFINQVRLRSTVEGKGLVRVLKANYEAKTIVVLLPHKYTNKSIQAKILLSFKKNLNLEVVTEVEKML